MIGLSACAAIRTGFSAAAVRHRQRNRAAAQRLLPGIYERLSGPDHRVLEYIHRRGLTCASTANTINGKHRAGWVGTICAAWCADVAR